jgi:hypothetical protein
VKESDTNDPAGGTDVSGAVEGTVVDVVERKGALVVVEGVVRVLRVWRALVVPPPPSVTPRMMPTSAASATTRATTFRLRPLTTLHSPRRRKAASSGSGRL